MFNIQFCWRMLIADIIWLVINDYSFFLCKTEWLVIWLWNYDILRDDNGLGLGRTHLGLDLFIFFLDLDPGWSKSNRFEKMGPRPILCRSNGSRVSRIFFKLKNFCKGGFFSDILTWISTFWWQRIGFNTFEIWYKNNASSKREIWSGGSKKVKDATKQARRAERLSTTSSDRESEEVAQRRAADLRKISHLNLQFS